MNYGCSYLLGRCNNPIKRSLFFSDNIPEAWEIFMIRKDEKPILESLSEKIYP